jgi:hypothetical protein
VLVELTLVGVWSANGWPGPGTSTGIVAPDRLLKDVDCAKTEPAIPDTESAVGQRSRRPDPRWWRFSCATGCDDSEQPVKGSRRAASASTAADHEPDVRGL